VGEVSEPGLACLDILGDIDGLGDSEVGGVRFLAESVDDEDGNTADEIADGCGNGSAIGQVGGTRLAIAVDSEAGGGDGAVGNGKGGKGQRSEGKRAGDGMRFGANVGRAPFFDIEGVVEGFFQPGESEWIGINGYAVSVFHGVGSKIIEAGDMIGVAVGIQDGIESRDGSAKGLGAEIG